jgi:hypothetical protein
MVTQHSESISLYSVADHGLCWFQGASTASTNNLICAIHKLNISIAQPREFAFLTLYSALPLAEMHSIFGVMIIKCEFFNSHPSYDILFVMQRRVYFT